jgi:hypothetical protein
MKIKFAQKLICLIISYFLMFSIHSNAQITGIALADTTIVENTLDINVETNYMKRYLWRGLLFGNDDVCQPVLGITYKKWTLNLSSNINYVPKNVPKESYTKPVAFDEQDIEILYSDKIGKLDYEIKADMYIYFHQINSPSTAEFNAKFSYPVYKNFTLSSENVFDVNAYSGAYYNNTALEWAVTKGKTDIGIGVNMGMGNAAFNNTYFGGETSGIFYWGTSVEVKQQFKQFYARINGEYNFYNKEEIKVASEINNTSNLSITIGKDFKIKLPSKKYRRK